MWISYAEDIKIWVTAEHAYNERVSPVENHVTARLRGRLGTARDANVMLKVYQTSMRFFS